MSDRSKLMFVISVGEPNLKAVLKDIKQIPKLKKKYDKKLKKKYGNTEHKINLGIEVRADKTRSGLGKIIETAKSTGFPVIYTDMLPFELEGTPFNGELDDYNLSLDWAIRKGVDYVSIGVDYYEQIKSTVDLSKTKVIVSFHDFNQTPQDMIGVYERLKRLKPPAGVNEEDFIRKIAVKANDYDDSLKVLDIIRQAKNDGVSIIALAMGVPGIWLRLFGLKCGNKATFCAIDGKGNDAFLSLKELYDPGVNLALI